MGYITVRGAGIFGLSVAWECVCRGAKVQVIDPNGPGAGSSGGVLGALAPHVPENWNPKKAFQLDSLLMAEGFWSRVNEIGGCDPGYLRSGRIQPLADDAALTLANERSTSAKTLWQSKATWTVERPTGQAWEPPSPAGWIVRDDLSALLHPRQAIDALVAALAARGVRVTPSGQDRGKLLWATGIAGLDALNEGRERQVGAGVKGQAAVLNCDMRGAPQIFVDGLHIIPHRNGTVAVGSTSERDFDHPQATDEQLERLIQKARHAIPALREAAVLHRWAGVRPRARSRAPMLGDWPDRPGHFIANGGFKIGFGMAPKVAKVMADLMLEGRNQIPAGFEVTASL